MGMKFLRRIHYWLNHRREAAELAEEIEAHRQMRQAQLEESGLSEQEASFASRRAMGNAVRAAEQAREIWTWRWLGDSLGDLMLGLRDFRKFPVFWIGASLILSLGLGINIAAFQFMDALFWRPPEIRDPETMVRLFKAPFGGLPYPITRMFDGNNSAFSSFLIRSNSESRAFGDLHNLVWGDDPANQVRASFVSSNWFEELGIRPKYGRTFQTGTDDAAGAPPTVVISQVLWERLLDSDPEIVGKTVQVNKRAAVVVGVVPPDVMPSFDMVWMPISQIDYFVPGTPFKTSWDLDSVQIYGRLKPGVPLASVRGALRPLMNEVRKLQPQAFGERDSLIPSPASARFNNPRFSSARRVLGVSPATALGLTLLVLVIACANLMNLVLSRAMNKVRDLSIRVSLGAGRSRIMRQLLAESALLVVFSSIVALVLVYGGTQIFLAMGPFIGPQFDFSWRTIVATVVVGSIAVAAIGLLPAWKISRGKLSVKQTSAGLGRTRWQPLLLAAQVGCSCLLLVLTGLVLRSLQQSMADVGFDYDDVAVLTVPLARQGFRPGEASSYWNQLQETLKSHPEVESVSLVPRSPSGMRGGAAFDTELTGPASYSEVGPGFFAVLRIPILAGREFEATDAYGASVILSPTLAMKVFGSTDVIGRSFPTGRIGHHGGVLEAPAKASRTATVIGVTPDPGFGESDPEKIGALYMSLNPDMALDGPRSDRALLVRARSNAAGIVHDMRNAALNLNRSLFPQARLLAQDFEGRRAEARMILTVLAVLGSLALSITCIGVFGTVSYAATLRRPEIGIRMALGEARNSILLLLLKQLHWPLSRGMAYGLLAAIPAGGLLSGLRVSVNPFDPTILALVGVFVLLTAIAAAFLPAWQAVRQDPMTSLRAE
jgi:predicted permease